MRLTTAAAALWMLGALLACAGEDPAEQAKRLKAEAIALLQSNRGRNDPAVHAKALARVEQALALITPLYEKDNARWEKRRSDMAALLYWTRKTAPITAITPSLRPAVSKRPQPSAAPNRAQKALDAALAYERAHPKDHFNVSLRLFKVSEEYTGTEAARTAFRKATWHQKQAEAARRAAEAAKAGGPKTGSPAQSEAERLAQRAGELLNDGNLDEAVKVAKESIGRKPNVEAYRTLGYAYYGQGSELAKEYLRQYNKVRAAFYRGGRRRARAMAQYNRLKRTLVPKIQARFAESRRAYNRAIELAGGKDLESEVQIALSLSHEIKDRQKLLGAKRRFTKVLTYKSTSMTDDTLLAKARAQLGRVNGRLRAPRRR